MSKTAIAILFLIIGLVLGREWVLSQECALFGRSIQQLYNDTNSPEALRSARESGYKLGADLARVLHSS